MMNGGPDVRVPVPLAAGAVTVACKLMASLPREMDGPAVSPRDFEQELDLLEVVDPLRRALFHRLRRAYVEEYRACLARRRA